MLTIDVSVGRFAFDYAYLPQTRMHVSASNSCGSDWSRSYEGDRNLIATVTNFYGSSVVASYAYGNDALGRRVARNGDSFAYNARSELTNATVSADAYGYGFDSIGNLLFSACNTATNAYSANCLNQYTNLQSTAYSLQPSYDLDGNMLTNGVWTYTWDAENRLSGIGSNGATLVSNAYDYLGRRFRKITGVVTNTFVYDGWNLYREVEAAGSVAVTNIYVWGLDLSGTLQGAGGVGGLLAVLRNGTPYFPCYDANGNVTDYVDAGGTVVAHREYDPFGKTVAAAGPLVHDLHFWFSTKYLEEETGLYYYGYRFYAPERMRWLCRDPIEERGGLNLYGCQENDTVNKWDYLGLNTDRAASPFEFVGGGDIVGDSGIYLGLWFGMNDYLSKRPTHALFKVMLKVDVSECKVGGRSQAFNGTHHFLSARIENGDEIAEGSPEIYLNPLNSENLGSLSNGAKGGWRDFIANKKDGKFCTRGMIHLSIDWWAMSNNPLNGWKNRTDNWDPWWHDMTQLPNSDGLPNGFEPLKNSFASGIQTIDVSWRCGDAIANEKSSPLIFYGVDRLKNKR